MKKLWLEFRPVIGLLLVWRLILGGVELWAPKWLTLRPGFLGPVPWANLDGVHYLSIAQHGYSQFEQAFFPLYPWLIRWGSQLTGISPVTIGLAISYLGLLIGLGYFFRLAKTLVPRGALWSVIFLLAFPTSFFFASVYTEGLFLGLAVATVYFATRKQWLLSGILGALAGLTRLAGIFLGIVVLAEFLKTKPLKRKLTAKLSLGLVPLGLVFYLGYLWRTVGDPLAFFHAQPAFGAGRSGEEFILLPQVLWRYAKIFLTVPFWSLSYQVAILELGSFLAGLSLLWVGWRQKIPSSYLVYSGCLLIIPTLTGTLSSLPRYFLAAFPLFFVLGNLHNRLTKTIITLIFIGALIILTSWFLQGYFVA